MKKAISIALVISILLALTIICTACTDETQGMLYEKIDGKKEYRLFDTGKAKSDKIVIPKTYNGLPVTEIADEAFMGKTYIKSITMPNSITKIGTMAFNNCRNLEKIKLSVNIQEIPYQAFVNCEKLNEIDIPSKVTRIGADAFICAGLKSLVIPDQVQYIEYRAFYGCYKLETVIIGKSVISIQLKAFENCNKLTSATFVDPNNWQLTGIIFGEGNLEDPQKLASYLTDPDYCLRIWTKNNQE